MKRGYYLITFKRGEEIKTITDNNTHPLIFLKIEKEIGNKTSILFYKELTEEEYKYSISRLAKGQCRHCSSERLENSNSFCEKHWFEYVAKAHLGTMKRGNELKKILELQDYRCAYTGIKLIPALNASIDHKIPLSTDVSQYQKIENLQWVCLDINIMKRNHSEDDFLKYIKLIYENRF